MMRQLFKILLMISFVSLPFVGLSGQEVSEEGIEDSISTTLEEYDGELPDSSIVLEDVDKIASRLNVRGWCIIPASRKAVTFLIHNNEDRRVVCDLTCSLLTNIGSMFVTRVHRCEGATFLPMEKRYACPLYDSTVYFHRILKGTKSCRVAK